MRNDFRNDFCLFQFRTIEDRVIAFADHENIGQLKPFAYGRRNRRYV